MQLKVFVKLKKTIKTLSSGQKTQKNPKKNQKNPKKTKKTHCAGFFLKPGFFQPWCCLLQGFWQLTEKNPKNCHNNFYWWDGETSVQNDADPDPTFHFDADLGQDSGSRSYHMIYRRWNTRIFFYFYSHHHQSTLFYISRQRHRCHNFQYFGHYFEIFWKKV